MTIVTGITTPTRQAELHSQHHPALSWLLVPSFLLGPSSWEGVARELAAGGDRVVVPNPRSPEIGWDDFITPWVEDIIEIMMDQPTGRVVLVGHSASCPRLPLLAERLSDQGHDICGVVFVNGRLPNDGVSPIEEDFPMRDMLENLVRPDDYLPPWPRWWGPLVFDMLPSEQARQKVFREARCVPLALFSQPVPAPDLDEHVGVAYLTMGEMYRPSAQKAAARGWVVSEVVGEHLHMVVNPVEVADTLREMVRCFASPA